MFIGTGAALAALGAGFITAGYLDPTLHSAFVSGGYLWSVIGALTIGFGLRQKSKRKLKEALR